MLVPRYYFADMYTDLYDYFLSQPHRLCTFHKSDMLWNLGETIRYVYYIKSGITKTFIEHEDLFSQQRFRISGMPEFRIQNRGFYRNAGIVYCRNTAIYPGGILSDVPGEQDTDCMLF